MKAEGLVFMSRSTPSLTRDASGEPQLLLRTVHRAGKHHTEAWTLFWRGQAAAEFHAAHAAELTAGQPLHITATNLRTHQVGHLAEIHARIESCALVPRVAAAAQTTNPTHATGGLFMSEIVSREIIERRARELAAVYDNLVDACPYPFGSAAALAFAEAFERERKALAEQEPSHG